MIDIDLLEVIRRSFTMIILIFCSIIALTFAIERWWFFKRISLAVGNFMAVLKKHAEEGDFKAALNLCKSTDSPIARVMEVAIMNHRKSKTQIMELMTATYLEERMRMDRFILVLGTMGTICPFIGLFGTVIGIIKAFHDLAISGSGGPAVVAAGISEALVTTAAGLAIAVPSVVLFNYFMKKIKTTSSIIEAARIRILVYLNVN